MKPHRLLFLVAAFAALLFSRPLAAQNADIIRGRVVNQDSLPVENVTVTVTSLSGNVNRSAKTDRNGRFTVTFPGGDGDYFVTFSALGYAPRRFEVKRTADQDILVADARLTKTGTTLDTITSIGNRARPNRNDATRDISGTERPVNVGGLPPDQQGDLAAMAASLPGVLFIPGSNGDPSGFSVLGLGADQNSQTLNGMDFGGSNLPRDANISGSLVTAPYDVSRGGFSGGQFNIRTNSGTNYIGRTSSLIMDHPSLQWTDPAARALGQQTTQGDLSGSLSGPISFDKAYYSVAYDLGRSSNDLQDLLNTNPLGLQTAGISSDSVTRLLNILQNAHLPATVGHIPQDKLSDRGSLLGVFDFAPPSSTSGQAFNFTTAGSWNKVRPLVLGTSDLPSRGLDLTAWNGSLQGRHTNYYGFGILSETSVSTSASHNFSTPYAVMPGGSVLVNSSFADGTNGVKNLTFGGTPFEIGSTNYTAGLTNQLSWFSEDNKHRIKFTTDVRRLSYSSDQNSNLLGSFTYNSLADLEADRPAAFTRTLAPRTIDGNVYIAGFSLGDSYRRSPDLQIQYGVRVDGQRFPTTPSYNSNVQSIFGLNNDHAPNGFAFSPRVGFSWTYGTAPQIAGFDGAVRGPRAVVRGGIGLFQNTPQSAQVLGNAINNTGLPTGLQQITCVGAAAPVPDWTAYEANPASIPTQCADGSTGTVFASSAPNVNLFANDYAFQRSVRSNLNWAGAVLDNRFTATVDASYSLNLNQPSFEDVNFNPITRFTLGGEGGRPVFVQPTSIVPTTGAIASGDARVSSLFNHVTEARSDLRSETHQLQVSIAPVTFSTNYRWSVTYTYRTLHEQYRGFSSTVANPFDVTWGYNGGARHQLSYSLFYNFFDAVRVSWSGSVFSGNSYTPVVQGDVNGDGYAFNDRAFIFDPAHTADTALASAMKTLLSGASGGARSCLNAQLGQLANRNSCEGPWTTSANASISFNPLKVRMPQRATLSFSVANPIGGLDLLMHGENNLRGWGQTTNPDPSLLYVRGFDPVAQRYTYQVNQRFGATNLAINTFRNPVKLTAMVRVDVGPTRERQLLTQTLDRGRATQGSRIPEATLKAIYGTGGVYNPMAQILRQSDTLQLTTKQADSVATLNRWYIVHLDSIWSPVARYLAGVPDKYDQDEAYDHYRNARQGSVDLLIKIAPDIKGLLTPEQIRKLPDLVTSYLDARYLAAIRSGTAGSGVFGGGPLGLPAGGGVGVRIVGGD